MFPVQQNSVIDPTNTLFQNMVAFAVLLPDENDCGCMGEAV